MRKLALLSSLLIFSLATSAQVIDKPIGCFAGTNGTNSLVLSHPEARGVLLVEKWKNIEQSPGVFDFTDLQNKIHSVRSAGLPYSLAIAAGAFGSPDWLIDSLQAGFHPFQYQNQSWKLPLWWDPVCDQRLANLIVHLGEQYAADSFLSHVYVSQMTVNGVEGHLNGVDMASFSAAGFSNQKWITAAKTTATAFADAFPDKPIVFEIHEIDHDTIVPAQIIRGLTNDASLCDRVGLAMWWISGKTSYQTNLLDFIRTYSGDKYAQVIGRSDQLERFEDSLYHTVFTQAKDLGIRYVEPWPYEFQHHTHDSLLQDFNLWADAHFSPSDSCSLLSSTQHAERPNPPVRMYPNPTSGQLNLQIEVLYRQLAVSLFNLAGQEMLHTSNQTELKISHLAAGTYFLRVQLDQEISIHPIVILK